MNRCILLSSTLAGYSVDMTSCRIDGPQFWHIDRQVDINILVSSSTTLWFEVNLMRLPLSGPSNCPKAASSQHKIFEIYKPHYLFRTFNPVLSASLLQQT